MVVGAMDLGCERATVTIPTVFPVAVDPVGSGFVDNLSRTPTRRALRDGSGLSGSMKGTKHWLDY